jgi:hypothetical protein
MGIQDNKTFSLNISGRQLIGIVVTFALCAVAIYAEALTIGYIVITLGLCVFFLVVGFDYGLSASNRESGEPSAVAESGDSGPTPKARSGRSARTA